MKAKPIAFAGMAATEIKRARALHEGTLGLKASSEFNQGVWIKYQIGPDTLAIGSVGDQWKPSPDDTSVAIEVEDFEDALQTLEKANAPVLAENIRARLAEWRLCRTPTAIRSSCTSSKPTNAKETSNDYKRSGFRGHRS